MRCRHAEAVRCTATYLDLRAAVEPAATPATAPHALLRVATVDHPARPTRGELGSSHAATLLTSCEVPVAGAATGRGGEALSAPRPGFPRRLAADQWAALASPHRDQGWTVIHLPSTLGGCGPFDSQPMVEIKRGRPNTNGTLTALSTQIALSLSCPATSPASPPPPASTDPALD